MPIIGVIASSDRNAPGAPTIGTATNVGTGRAYNDGRADVTFTAPTYTGGLPITSYTVTSSPGGFTGTGASSPISVTGLQSGVSYTFTVTATNAAGTSAASAASNSITATTVPQAPTIGTATAGNAQASVTFTAGATGGSTITQFTATSSPGSITGTAASSPITVTGLTNGTAYTFTVTATNANGTSAASAASNSITPVSPTSYESIASFNGAASTTSFAFTSIPQTYKHLQLRVAVNDSNGNASTLRFNNDNTSVYSWHYMRNSSDVKQSSGNGSASSMTLGASNGVTNEMTMYIIDIHDYTNTSVNKTVRTLGGRGTAEVVVSSGCYYKTDAITVVNFLANRQVSLNTRVSLYGIKG